MHDFTLHDRHVYIHAGLVAGLLAGLCPCECVVSVVAVLGGGGRVGVKRLCLRQVVLVRSSSGVSICTFVLAKQVN
jgi:hypothetical protein